VLLINVAFKQLQKTPLPKELKFTLSLKVLFIKSIDEEDTFTDSLNVFTKVVF
jgi:hypothetical protein